jgi:hypothetical protein
VNRIHLGIGKSPFSLRRFLRFHWVYPVLVAMSVIVAVAVVINSYLGGILCVAILLWAYREEFRS